jgi:hypothetical protein
MSFEEGYIGASGNGDGLGALLEAKAFLIVEPI